MWISQITKYLPKHPLENLEGASDVPGCCLHTDHLHSKAGGTKPCLVTALCVQYLLYLGAMV